MNPFSSFVEGWKWSNQTSSFLRKVFLSVGKWEGKVPTGCESRGVKIDKGGKQLRGNTLNWVFNYLAETRDNGLEYWKLVWARRRINSKNKKITLWKGCGRSGVCVRAGVGKCGNNGARSTGSHHTRWLRLVNSAATASVL